jgi:hypothetical protein
MTASIDRYADVDRYRDNGKGASLPQADVLLTGLAGLLAGTITMRRWRLWR